MRIVSGFSLIEVLVALMMASITITSLLALQNTLQTMLFKDNAQWQAEQHALHAFTDAEKGEPLEPGKRTQQVHDNFKVVYTVEKPREGTPLSELETLVLETVTVSWAKVMGEQTFTLTKYTYRPKKEKEKASPDTAPAPVQPGSASQPAPQKVDTTKSAQASQKPGGKV